jgi:hypothetical protein
MRQKKGSDVELAMSMSGDQIQDKSHAVALDRSLQQPPSGPCARTALHINDSNRLQAALVPLAQRTPSSSAPPRHLDSFRSSSAASLHDQGVHAAATVVAFERVLNRARRCAPQQQRCEA